MMPLFYVPALRRYTADACIAIRQILGSLESSVDHQNTLNSTTFTEKWSALQKEHKAREESINAKAVLKSDTAFDTAFLCKTLRNVVPDDTVFAIEAVTNSITVSEQIHADLPGQYINCGGGGLGWSGGGALGIKLAVDATHKLSGASTGPMVVQIVGDGSFLFTVPSSVYWISHRYKIPILTIVLNNKG
jgi:thiamine pyrophosphate-dependent acetolactate synthase large subunit-like protein